VNFNYYFKEKIITIITIIRVTMKIEKELVGEDYVRDTRTLLLTHTRFGNFDANI